MQRLLVLAFLLCPPSIARAEPVDPHALFEEKCGRCHNHAGAFAREKLTIEDSEVVGRRSKKRVVDTLTRHFGKISEEEAGLIVDMFRRQILSDGLYQEKCRTCHEPAKDLARRTLILTDGHLVGRYSGRRLEDFLAYHGRLDAEQQRIIFDRLAWQLAAGEADAD